MARKIMDYLIPLHLILLIGSFILFMVSASIVPEDNPKFLLAFFIPYFFFLFLILIGTVFRAWMLVDCALRKFKSETEKILWVLVIFVAGLLGTVIYYYVLGRKKR